MNKKEKIARAGTRVIIAGIFGLVVGILIGSFLAWKYAWLAAWDTAALIFLVWMFVTLYGRNAEETSSLATREDPGHAASDIVLVLASVASIAAVGVILSGTSGEKSLKTLLEASLSILSVIISWATVHVVYTLRYAREYYKNEGCIDFNDKHKPRYSDFAYLAFTVGLTFQVSDTNIKSNEIRRIILRHALLSYLFGSVIIAVTINLIAGLGK